MVPRLAFAGGLKISWHCLKALCEQGITPNVAFGYDPSLCHRSGYCDLGDLCEKYHITYHRINDINSDRVADELRRHEIDLFLVWNWSQLVKPPILAIPKQGCIGMHPTRLPIGRGRAPIPWSIIKGIRHSAVSIFFLTPGVDDGDIIWQEPFEIFEDDDSARLYHRLELIHEQAVRQFCRLLRSGPLPRTPQDPSQATHWPKRRPTDGVIDWSKSTAEQLRWIRALTDPYPGAFTFLDGQKYFIWSALSAPGSNTSGTLIGPGEHQGVLTGTADAGIEILIAQREGGPRQSGLEFLNSGEWKPGMQFTGEVG
jgi:methionyl-tRNA formyltransferase